jgi:hypothetical protein
MMQDEIPNAIPFPALKSVARQKGYRVAIGETPNQLVVLERKARDRNPLRFRDRDAAMAHLKTLPDAPPVRY